MDSAILATSLAIINVGRPFDGGIFRIIRESRLLQTLAVNNGTTAAMEAFNARLSGRILTGGSIAMLVAACFSALVLATLAFCSLACACRTMRRERIPRGSYLSVPAQRQRENTREKSSSCYLAGSCMLMLALTLIPLILASAANFRLRQSLTPLSHTSFGSDGQLEHSVEDQITRLLDKADAFIGGLVAQIRLEAAPVMREGEELVVSLKKRAQATYEAAFKQSTGAAQLLEAGDELLRRMSDFYNAGRNLSAAQELLQSALSDLKNAQFFTYEDACRRHHVDSDGICANHSRAVVSLRAVVQAARDDWTQANSSTDGSQRSSSLKTHAKSITKLVYQLVGALDGSGNTPDRQQEIRERKIKIGDEINQNISAVFDRDLNSTKFLMDSVDAQLQLLQDQLDSARVDLAGIRLQFPDAYSNATVGPERARFGITQGLLLLFFVCIVALAAGAAPVVLKSLKTGSRMRYFVGLIYLVTFLLIATAIILNTAMYIATAVVQAEVCRYLLDTQSPANQTKGDEFLVPEINDFLTDQRNQTSEDHANATLIPIRAVGSVLTALQHSCSENLPLLVAMGADKYLDEAAFDKKNETIAFQSKGLDILRREMQNLNLEQIREEKLVNDLRNLRPFFRPYTSTDFAKFSSRLMPRSISAAQIKVELADFQRLNDLIDRLLPESESTVKQLSAMNSKTAARSLHAVEYLRQYASEFSKSMLRLEAQKDVNSVVDKVIDRSQALDVYLTNRSLWVETAIQNYRDHIMSGTLNESLRIGQQVGARFLTSIVRCRSLHEMYTMAVQVPCATMLHPLAILCFCIGWLLCCACVLVLVTMLCFCHSRGWITNTGALRQVESALIDTEEMQETSAGRSRPASVSNGQRRASRRSRISMPESSRVTASEVTAVTETATTETAATASNVDDKSELLTEI